MKRALAVAALLAAVACGVKAPPRPPIEPRPAQAGAPAATDEGKQR